MVLRLRVMVCTSTSGAMMNHFVIANYYDDGREDRYKQQQFLISMKMLDMQTGTKILKYYSGATSGTVELGILGLYLMLDYLLKEMLFWEEEVQNNGEVIDTTLVLVSPIGSVDADENGEFSFIVPAGRIRVTAMTGIVDLQSDRDAITSARVIKMLGTLGTETFYLQLLMGKNGKSNYRNPCKCFRTTVVR